MAKRMFDSKSFSSKQMRGLQGAYKLLWIYIKHTCDHVGIWEVELDIAGIRCGFDYSEDECLKVFGSAIVQVGKGESWWIPEFIEEQYGWQLNPNNKVHKSVLENLKKNNLLEKFNSISVETVQLVSPLQGAYKGAKDKDIDKEEAKAIEKETEIGGLGEREPLLPMKLAECVELYKAPAYEMIRNTLCRNLNDMPHERLLEWLDVFADICIGGGTLVNTMDDFKQHFRNWILKKHRDNELTDPKTYFKNGTNSKGKQSPTGGTTGGKGGSLEELLALRAEP